MVMEEEKEIIGYMVYELHQSKMNLLNLAVREDQHRRGVGESMTMQLNHKLSAQRRQSVEISIPESCEVGQMYLSACGFHSIGSSEETGKQTGESGIMMRMPKFDANFSKTKNQHDWLKLADAFLASAA